MKKEVKSLSSRIETEVLSEQDVCVAPVQKAKGLADRVEKTRIRQKSYVVDLRIHSPASLGYLGVEGLDTAPALVRLARVKGLDLIAVTDFYSAQFINRVREAAKNINLTIIPGTVIRCSAECCDDIILSCLFPENYGAEHVEEFLHVLSVPESARGDRRYILRQPIGDVLSALDRYQGVALPSRMDKTPYRMGAIPLLVEEYGFRAFDLAYPDSARFFKSRWPKMKFQLFSFSNANALAQVGSRIARVKMSVPGFQGIREIVGRHP